MHATRVRVTNIALLLQSTAADAMVCLLASMQVELETEMRTFFRRYFTHNRYVSATATPLDALQLDGTGAAGGTSSIDLRSLYLDLRPYMNRSPFTVRKDCSASRAHQVGSSELWFRGLMDDTGSGRLCPAASSSAGATLAR